MIERRKFLIGIGSLLAAPAIVQASSLMPIKAIEPFYFSGNQLLTINMITREAIKLFRDSNAFLKNLDLQEEWRNPARLGSTLRIRLPNDYIVCAGPAIPQIDTELVLAAAAPLVIAKALETPVSRRFWAA